MTTPDEAQTGIAQTRRYRLVHSTVYTYSDEVSTSYGRGLAVVGVEEPAGLPGPELGVVPATGEELGVGALLHDPALVEHHQPVHRGDGREAVSDGDHRLVGHQRLQLLLDRGLDFAVERRGRLIQHQDRRVLQQHAGNGDALALPAGEFYAPFADMGVVASAALGVGKAPR